MYRFLAVSLLVLGMLSTVSAQEIVYTSRGERVILYPNGTWAYASALPSTPGGRPDQCDPTYPSGVDPRQHYSMRLSGKRAGNGVDLVVDGVLHLVIEGGELKHWEVLEYGIPITNRHYGLSGRLSQVGSYDVEYDFVSDRLVRIGSYRIEYGFISNKVERIGAHRIEYDFFSGKVERIGETRIKYWGADGEIREVSGRTPGLVIFLY